MQYKIISFDPGISSLGWALSVYDMDCDILEVQRFGTLKASKLASKQKELSDTYGSRVMALKEVEDHVRQLVTSFSPDYVCSEDAFFCTKYPNAYGALLMCVHSVRRVLFDMHESEHITKPTARVLHTFAPMMIKRVASSKATSNKSDMLAALTQNNKIVFKSTKADILTKMDEHEVDAISCGYTFVTTTLPTLLCSQ